MAGWINASAGVSSSMTALYGPVPWPIRLRYGNSTSPQTVWDVVAYISERPNSTYLAPVDLTGLESIPAGGTMYSQSFSATSLGLWVNSIVYLRSTQALSVWREQLIGGQWRRDQLSAVVTLSASVSGSITVGQWGAPYCDTLRFGARNTGGATSTQSMLKLAGRGD